MEGITFIRISEIILNEPVTFITDAFVAIVCLHCSLQLKKIDFPSEDIKKAWFYFFLFTSISTFSGGIAHLLSHYTGKLLHIITWQISGFGIFSGEIATCKMLNDKKAGKLLKRISEVKLLIYLFLVVYIQKFDVVIINSVIGLIGFVFIVNVINYIKTREHQSYLIALGLLICFLSVFIYNTKISLHKWFNHNDLSHVVLSAGLYVIFLGTKKIDYCPVTET